MTSTTTTTEPAKPPKKKLPITANQVTVLRIFLLPFPCWALLARPADHIMWTAFVFGDRTHTYAEFGALVQGTRDLLAAEVPEAERRIYGGVRSLFFWWALFVGLMAALYAYMFWFQFYGPAKGL